MLQRDLHSGAGEAPESEPVSLTVSGQTQRANNREFVTWSKIQSGFPDGGGIGLNSAFVC